MSCTHKVIYEDANNINASTPLLSDVSNGPHKLELQPRMKLVRSVDLSKAHNFSLKYVEDKDIPEFCEVYFKIGNLKTKKIKIKSRCLIESFIKL